MSEKLFGELNNPVIGIGIATPQPSLENSLCLNTEGKQRMIRMSPSFMGIVSLLGKKEAPAMIA
jgi:hypothetical protein